MFTSDHRITISTNEPAGHISSQLTTKSLTNARLHSKRTTIKCYAVNPPIPCLGVIHKAVTFASAATQLLRMLHQLLNRLQRATTKLAQMCKGAALEKSTERLPPRRQREAARKVLCGCKGASKRSSIDQEIGARMCHDEDEKPKAL